GLAGRGRSVDAHHRARTAERRSDAEAARVGEKIEHVLAVRLLADEPSVLSVIQEQARLLPGEDVDQEAHPAVLLDDELSRGSLPRQDLNVAWPATAQHAPRPHGTHESLRERSDEHVEGARAGDEDAVTRAVVDDDTG